MVNTSSFGRDGLNRLEAAGLRAVANPHGRTLSEAELERSIMDNRPVGIIAGLERLGGKAMGIHPGLKVVSRCGIGMENVDLAAASKLGIKVFNTPEAPAQAVAELTIALMLNLLRRVGEADRALRRNKWEKLSGRLLGEMTVGIIGCGRIGSKVAGYLKAFGCRIIGHDIAIDKHRLIEMVPLEELIKTADIITLHLAVSEKTVNMVNEQFINAMKPGSYLINLARGEIIDENALITGLRSGQLAGAALDTFVKEPYSGPLTGLENVVLTAHMGSYAREARAKMEREAVDNLLKGLEVTA